MTPVPASDRLALLGGLVLAAALSSSCVAWKFGFPSELGRPLWWHLYDPFAIVAWARAWGLEPGYRSVFLGGLAAAAGLMVLPLAAVRLVRFYGPLRAQQGVAGAGLSTARDLIKTGRFVMEGQGIVVGMAGRRVLRDRDDAHALIYGPTRSGKGAGHVVPTLLTWTGSVLCYDPKNELSAIVGRFRQALGPTFLFDPTCPTSARFNPVLTIREGWHLAGDCQAAAHMLTHPGTGHGGDDPFWDDAAASLVAALLMIVRTGDDPTLAHLWRLIGEVAVGVVPDSPLASVRLALERHAALAEKMRSSVMTTIATRLQFLDDPAVQAATSGDEIRPADLQAGERPCTVFLGMPLAQADRLRPLSRLVLSGLLAPLLHDPHRTADGRRKARKLLLLLDEFPTLGRMDVLENGLSTCAGYGIRAMLCAQDEDQIRRLYGPHHSLAANCRTHCFTASLSGGSIDAARRRTGDHLVVRGSRQRPVGTLGRGSRSESETMAPVLEAGELIELATDHVLVHAHGLRRPARLRKVRYWQQREFRGLFDPPDAPRIGLREPEIGDDHPSTVPAIAPPPPARPGLTVRLDEDDLALWREAADGAPLPEFLAGVLRDAAGALREEGDGTAPTPLP